MQLDQNPYFRKSITPWYDSTFACRILIWSMALVFCFSLGGVVVAAYTSEFSKHLWFPVLLGALAGFLVIKVLLRLKARDRHD